MKTKKRFLSILLSLALVLGLIPGMSLTAYAASSGKNGGFNWTLDDDGKMTVTGSGALPGRFINQNGDIKSIVFDENCQVSGLAQYSIYCANNATEIIINSTADLTIAGNAIFWFSDSGGDPVSITINAPKVTIGDAEPFFAYSRKLSITVNTNELIVYNGTMSYLGRWNNNNSFAYPANSTVYIPAGYVFTQSYMQEQYDHMAQNGMEEMFWRDYGVTLTEGRDYTYNAEASSVALTSENAGTVFGGAQTSSSNAYTAAHNHSFTYSASGATITATCGGTGICDITEGLTLTISAPTGNLVYDGTTTYPASLSTGYNTTAFPGTYSISYTKDGSAYSGAPKDAGTYTASVTVGTGDAAKTASVSYTIAKAAATVTKAPTAKTLTYNGSAQELVTAGTATGGTMQYALGKDATTAPTSGWSTSIPKATEAGTYYVWYKVKGDESHIDSEAACVTSTIRKKEISSTVTFKVANGSWDDGTTKDQTVSLKGYEGDELKLSKDQIPVVGKKPGSGYAAGTWDTTPDTATAITKDITYTYTYAKAAEEPSEEPSQEPSEGAAKVTKAPTAKKLTYNGKDQKLVAKGTASNGKMYYAVTKNTTAPKASAYKTSIPTGKAAGTYYVWYKAKGNTGYKDSAVKKVKVTIAKAAEEPFNFNTSFKVSQKDGQITVTWDKVNGLSNVDAYIAYCGTNYPAKKSATTTKNTLTIKKIAGKKIDLTKNFKLILAGYDSTGKKRKKSVSLHIAGKDNEQFTNVKSFTLSKSSVSIKKGKSTKVAVKTYKLEDAKKKEISNAHGAKFRYRSTNSKIAKVDKTGKITAVNPGKCKVFVYTRNGLARKVAVTVTK